jgi:hypothetical protein
MSTVSRLPGFVCDPAGSSLRGPRVEWSLSSRSERATEIAPALLMPYCHWEKVVCGSALPGYPVPMCWEYICVLHDSGRYSSFLA